MGHTSIERETKFEEVIPSRLADLADRLTRLPGVARVAPAPAEEFDAVYYDTADLALLSADCTLSRRSGGDDAGWQLKAPAPGGHGELKAPVDSHGSDEPPEELARHLRARVRGRLLTPVAHLRTHRARWSLLDEEDRVLAEVARDDIAAQVLGGERIRAALAGLVRPDTAAADRGAVAQLTSWSEVAVELREGAPSLTPAIRKRLRSAGLRTAAQPCELRHALSAADLSPGTRAARTAPGSAGEAVMTRLCQQVEVLLATDPAVRADAPDAVHRMRVAVRRLRAVLKSHRRLFKPGSTRALERELRWLGAQLGRPRDHEVLAGLLRRAAADVARDPRMPSANGLAGRIAGCEAAAYRRAWRQACEKLDRERYFALLDALEKWLADPPFTRRAGKSARGQLKKAVRRDHRRFVSRTRKALSMPDGPEREKALHGARKAARRLRYSAETARPVFGKSAKRIAKRAKAVQDVLGAYQDAVVARAALPGLADQEHGAGRGTFLFGVLHCHQLREAEKQLARLPKLWRKAARPKSFRLR
ncbi:CYTH and CHAD domain-containing protein [Streptomyces sp. RPT161]|uniref:CYTH and CHAD domain-containing protein n=1 Tax=Streptomyces sp. RPT161 TaxID=3015993 RepID=UPI0022B93B03|nr:CYTH and CHAD domain-containing protein [Streptomyces sp. RPT161]